MPKKRILVIYYTQTGQTLEIVRSLIQPLTGSVAAEVVLEALRPAAAFPFPWSAKAFFQVMPESVQGLGCPMEPLSVSADASFDLVILAWQAWFLSPSLPIQGFLQSTAGRALLKGRPVLTVTGCRNMWVMALEDIQRELLGAGARHVGNIVLRDRAPNLLSLFSIARWLLYNKKEKFGPIPRAGVAERDIARCREFGESLQAALAQGAWGELQARLVQQGAVEVLPDIVTLEKNGKRMFRIWSKFILRRGGYGDPARRFRLKAFELYLYVALLLLSPVSFVVFKVLLWAWPRKFNAMVKHHQAFELG